MPNTPQNAAGMRTDPAASVPRCNWPSPSAAAAAAPPDEPPVERSSFHGLRVMPVSGESHKPFPAEFGERRLADNDAARFFQPRRSRCVFQCGRIGTRPRAAADRKPGEQDVVLDRRDEPVSGTEWRALGPALLACLCGLAGAVAIKQDKSVDLRLFAFGCARAPRRGVRLATRRVWQTAR